MEDKDTITFKEFPDGSVQIYVEDAVGHHAAVFLKKDQLREKLSQIFSFKNSLQYGTKA